MKKLGFTTDSQCFIKENIGIIKEDLGFIQETQSFT